MSASVPLPQPSSARIDQVVAATRALFLRYGYRRTSVDDIAREAGVAKATLYLHFAGKEEMFRIMIRHFLAIVSARCDAAERSTEPVERRVVDLLYANYGTALEWFGDAAHISELKAFVADHPLDSTDSDLPAFRARIRRLLDDAAQAGAIELARVPSLEAVARTLIFAAVGAKRAHRGGADDFRDTLETIVALVVGGLRPR